MKRNPITKIIKALVVVIIIIAISVGIIIYIFAYQSESRGGTLKPEESISINCHYRFLKAFLTLEISTTSNNGEIKYYIKSPSNRILEQGEFDTSSNLNLDKKYPGYKGKWHIEFQNLKEGETLSYRYTFKAMNSGDKDRKR